MSAALHLPGFRERRVICHKFAHRIKVLIDLLMKIYQGADTETRSDTTHEVTLIHQAEANLLRSHSVKSRLALRGASKG